MDQWRPAAGAGSAADALLGCAVARRRWSSSLRHCGAGRRAASRLEHPDFAVIHDLGEVDGVSFIAMELVRGDKLSVAIATGVFAANAGCSLEIAVAIAEGLARAARASSIAI